MDAQARDYFNTDKTFGRSTSPVSFSQANTQIIPYSDPRFGSASHFHGGASLSPYHSAPRIDNENRYRFHGWATPPPLPPPSRSKSWNIIRDADTKRRSRIASYKMYTAEGKVKTSVSRTFRWIKNKYIELRYGLL